MKINIELPFFPGFYESDLENSDTSYWAIKEELEYMQDPYMLKEHPEYKTLTEDDLDFRYSDFEHDLAVSFADSWQNNAPSIVESVEFSEIVSPKYYNFSTDRLFADIELKEDWQEVMRAFMKDNADWLKERIEEDWTSYDGFHSFMCNDLSEWDKYLFEDMDERYISTMLGYMMYRENDRIREDLVMEAVEGDVYPGSYVFITDEAKERIAEDIREGRIIPYDPAQLELPLQF
jgi:hypothetical protein